MRKHLNKAILLAALCLLLAGCGQNRQDDGTAPEKAPTEQSEPAEQPSAADPQTPEDPEAGTPDAETGQTAYEDNFSVEHADAEAFARKIQDAVADKDLEGLADLMQFPNYVGFPEDAQFVDSREDFLSLGADRVFTEALLTEIGTADLSALEPSQAGFILSASGCPNIVFGVSEGQLAVVGINY